MATANIALAQNLYAAFGRGDIATIIGAVAPDIVWQINGRPEDHPVIGTFKGAAGVQEFFRLLAETEEVVSFSPREFHDAGDLVVVLGHYVWTMRKTGKPVTCEWVHLFTVKDGKVTSFREFTDTAQFAAAVRG